MQSILTSHVGAGQMLPKLGCGRHYHVVQWLSHIQTQTNNQLIEKTSEIRSSLISLPLQSYFSLLGHKE